MFDYWMVLKEQEPDYSLSNEDMKASIDHLANALFSILQVMDSINSGAFDLHTLAKKCEESWNELNKCRVYTEHILFIEEAIIPAMGEMYDAKMMFESLLAWKLGMTVHAAHSIRASLSNAEFAVRRCLDEMVSWLTPERNSLTPSEIESQLVIE